MIAPQLRFPAFTDEWQAKKLGDFLVPTLREVDKPKDEYLALGIRSHFKGTFQKPNSDPRKISMDKLYVVRANDFIVNITFAWEGALAIAGNEDDGGLVSHRFPTYTFSDSMVGNFFRYVYPTSKMKYSLELASPGGAGRNRVLNKKDLLAIGIRTPSVAEQQKIANYLGGVDSKLASIQNKVAAMHEYKKGVIQALFAGKLRFNDENGNPYQDWEEKKLGEIGEFIRGLTYNASNVKLSGSLVLRSSNIQNDKLVLDKDLQFVDKTFNDNLNLQKDDIVICMSNGSKRLVGKSAVYEGNYEGTLTVGAFCSIFRPQSQLAKYVFQSEQYQRYLHILLAGTNINNLNNSDLSNLLFKLPSPEEQQKIADFLSTLDDKIKLEEARLASAKEFKKALLQRMFV